MTVYMYIATLAWILLVLGYTRRNILSQHITLIVSGMTLDILLVIYLQLSRDAIQTAASFELSLPQQVHVFSSTLAIILYIPVAALGARLRKNRENDKLRKTHSRIAITTLFFRTLGFIFMFSMM